MILDYLNKTVKNGDFKVSYDIFEAADEDRKGGQLFTYNFKSQDGTNSPGPHNYYDVGAIRFPQNKVMTRCVSILANSSYCVLFTPNLLQDCLTSSRY